MHHSARRRYTSLLQVWTDIRHIGRNVAVLRSAMRGDLVSPAFRERLMLTVTAVNGCRYCSYAHSRLALRSGVSPQELAEFAKGSIPAGTPADEVIALLYAQHWAESNACPDAAAFHRLIAVYGQERADAIAIVLCVIRVGNLAGNSWDYLLHVIRRGSLPRSATMPSAIVPPDPPNHIPRRTIGDQGDGRAAHSAQLE